MSPHRLLACAVLAVCAALATLGAPPPLPTAAGEPPESPVLVLADQSTPLRDDPAPQAPPAPAPAREPRTLSLVMGGDLLWHNTVWQSAAADAAATGSAGRYDFDPMFAELRPLIRDADLALCHEEVPFARPGQPLQSYPVFAAPREVAPWLASMGFDGCTTASNHAVDQGWEGLRYTADQLDRHGVTPIGTFRSAAERRRPVILTSKDGVRVGVVAGTYGLNGFPLPGGRPWSVSMWDADNLLSQARRARRAGADIVVVHLHGGTEYDHLPTAEQEALVERLTRSPDVDLVLGEHAHVVQPITRVNGKWVVYGMGNMVAQQETSRSATYEGIVVRFVFAERPDGSFTVRRAAYVPTTWNAYGVGGPIRVRRISTALADARADRSRLLTARASIRAAVNGLGRSPGLHEG